MSEHARHQLLRHVRTFRRDNPDMTALEAVWVVLAYLAKHYESDFNREVALAINEMHDLKRLVDAHHREGRSLIEDDAPGTEAVFAHLAIEKAPENEALVYFLVMLEDGVWPEPSELNEG